MVNWNIVYTKQAQKDANKIASANLKDKTIELIEILRSNPYKSRSLKALAKELQVPVVALSQLNRGLEQRWNNVGR